MVAGKYFPLEQLLWNCESHYINLTLLLLTFNVNIKWKKLFEQKVVCELVLEASEGDSDSGTTSQ